MYRTVFKQKTNMADITQSLKYTDIYSNNSNNDNNSVKSVDNTQKKDFNSVQPSKQMCSRPFSYSYKHNNFQYYSEYCNFLWLCA